MSVVVGTPSQTSMSSPSTSTTIATTTATTMLSSCSSTTSSKLNLPVERKSKFKGKRPFALNLEAAKQEIGIGDGAEHRLTPASPGWARQRFANRIERPTTTTATPSSLSNEINNDENTPPSPNNNQDGSNNINKNKNNTGLSLVVPSKKRNARVAQLNLSNLSASSKLPGREPFDFAKRLREDYRRRYV
ncbi:hypothetical protein BDF22DRAFT_744985 [Syncephalis plumigaleata]|nr:hypothetical protein BDF22DRAFT_744985 [Syncephalis plumigaleata]